MNPAVTHTPDMLLGTTLCAQVLARNQTLCCACCKTSIKSCCRAWLDNRTSFADNNYWAGGNSWRQDYKQLNDWKGVCSAAGKQQCRYASTGWCGEVCCLPGLRLRWWYHRKILPYEVENL